MFILNTLIALRMSILVIVRYGSYFCLLFLFIRFYKFILGQSFKCIRLLLSWKYFILYLFFTIRTRNMRYFASLMIFIRTWPFTYLFYIVIIIFLAIAFIVLLISFSLFLLLDLF